jgi:hypothetical protein
MKPFLYCIQLHFARLKRARCVEWLSEGDWNTMEIEVRWRLKYDGDWNTMEIEIRLRLKYDDVWMNVHRYDNFLRWVSGAMRCRHAYKRKLGFTQEKAPGLEKGSKLKTVHTLKGTPRITLEKRALLIFNVYVRSTEIMFAANVCRHTCVHS